jgi:hypothetical protein
MRFPHFSCSALIALLSLPALTIAQTQEATATTDPVGYQTAQVPVGISALANPLVNADTVRSAVASNTASVVTLSGVGNVGELLTEGEPYYLEVVGGDLEGERFDVNTTATKVSANSTVTIDTLSANNTSILANGVLAEAQVALRKHVTLSQLQGFFSPPLIGNNNQVNADQIQLFNPSTGAFTAYYLRGNGTEWRPLGGGSGTSVNTLPVPPGFGFLVKKITAPTSYTSVGAVRNNDFAFPMPQGLSFRAPGYPVSYSPASLGGSGSNGWTGNNNAAAADQLQVYNADTKTFTAYYLRGNGTEWRPLGGGSGTGVTSEQLFASDAPFMVLKRQAVTDYILINPVVQ